MTTQTASAGVMSAQLDRAVETFRFLGKLTTELWTVFLSADAVLVTYGLATKSSGPMLIGSGFLLVAAIATAVILRSAIPVAYSAFVTEKALGHTVSDGLAQLFGRVALRDVFERFDEVARIAEDEPERVPVLLARVRSKAVWWLTFGFVAAFAIQVALGLILWLSVGIPLVP